MAYSKFSVTLGFDRREGTIRNLKKSYCESFSSVNNSDAITKLERKQRGWFSMLSIEIESQLSFYAIIE